MLSAPRAMPGLPGLMGQVTLVTGTSGWIGAETARYLLANGVAVVLNGGNRDRLAKGAAPIEAAAARASRGDSLQPPGSE